MNDKQIAKRRTAMCKGTAGTWLHEALDEIERLRKKLAITEDGVAVGLGDEVFRPEPNDRVSVRIIMVRGREFQAHWLCHGTPVDVSTCYASLERAHEAADAKDK